MSKTAKTKPKKTTSATARTKAEHILSLLSRPSGSSIAEMMKSTGWQAHSVRSFLAGSLKKKGHTVSSKLDQGGVRRYRLATLVEA